MHGASPVATFIKGAAFSWTGKTLALVGSGGVQSASHPHSGFVWISRDDGDTWEDETGDLVTMNFGIGQWFEGTLYLDSSGEGLMRKVLER